MSLFWVFLVCIFPHLDRIRKDNLYLFVFTLNAVKYRPEKVRVRYFSSSFIIEASTMNHPKQWVVFYLECYQRFHPCSSFFKILIWKNSCQSVFLASFWLPFLQILIMRSSNVTLESITTPGISSLFSDAMRLFSDLTLFCFQNSI